MEILIRQFTDPICTWCWGSEPIIRKLEYKIEGVKIGFVMGGLVQDIRDFGNPKANLDQLNNTIYKHWLEAEDKHFMPVSREGMDLFDEDHLSSFPQNIAYKAGQLQDEDLAKKLLRRIREATMVENLKTNHLDVLIDLADQVGLDTDKFREDMESGKAENEFDRDRNLTAMYGVRGFPSFTIKVEDKEVLMKGYQIYEAFVMALEDHLGVEVVEKEMEKSPEGVKDFLEKYEKVAPREIAYVFDLEEEEYDQIIAKLIEEGQAEKVDPWIINKTI